MHQPSKVGGSREEWSGGRSDREAEGKPADCLAVTADAKKARQRLKLHWVSNEISLMILDDQVVGCDGKGTK